MAIKSKSSFVLKVILIILAVVTFSIAGMIAFIVYHLPSGNELSAAILKRNKPHIAQPPPPVAAVSGSIMNANQQLESVVASDVNTHPQVTQDTSKNEATINSRAGLDDLVNPNKPLSNFCGSLKNSNIKKMNSKDEINKAFQLSLDEATADPRVQSMKPIFRYLFRLPALQDLVATIEDAAEKKEEGFADKASFYAKIVTAAASMRSHKEDLEAVADRSYLFYKLNALVAQKPDVINDERLKKFCDDTEIAFNENVSVQFDQEKKNFERLLAELDVDPSAISYDPNYKTAFDFNIGKSSIRLTGGWIEEIFSK